MIHYQRYHQSLKKGVNLAVNEEDEESQNSLCGNFALSKRTKPKLLTLLFLTLFSCTFIFVPQFLNFPSDFLLLTDSLEHEDKSLVAQTDVNGLPCSPVTNGTICCDRSSIRSDICIMKGDVRMHSPSFSLYLYTSINIKGVANYEPKTKLETERERNLEIQHEKIRPYTRKWETNTMSTIDELVLISKNKNSKNKYKCDVHHNVPAVFFSTGGYTGNVYHEFNDGILPLYITSQHFKKRVVFVILEYHDWWHKKYRDIIPQLSDFPLIDFSKEKKVHCFPEAIVGLRIHDELTVDHSLMEGGKTIRDFRALLDKSYFPRVKEIIREKEQNAGLPPSHKKSTEIKRYNENFKPKLVIISRNGSREITNQRHLVNLAEKIGFQVKVFTPVQKSELAKIYHELNSSDVMIGVHGAAMTHLLFMRPGSVFIQVVPLGTDWASETYYGEPAKKLGLKYIGYKIHPKESSLYGKYPEDDPILTDPNSLGGKGWEFTKKVYLDHQNVRLNLGRFQKRLVRAYEYTCSKKEDISHPERQ